MNREIWVVSGHSLTNQHSYVVGLYESAYDAEKAATIEAVSRKGLYKMRCYGPNDELIDIERD